MTARVTSTPPSSRTPTAPPLPYTFIGSFAPDGQPPVFFLAHGDRVIDARVGSDNLNAVTLSVEDVPLETAARLVAEVAGLKAVAVGNVIFVTTESRAAKLRAEQCGTTPERYPALPVSRPLLPPIHTPGNKKVPPEP